MSEALADAIRIAEWWQGSIVHVTRLNHAAQNNGHDYWIIATQTCNLYSKNFEQIPVFEVIAAKRIESLNAAFVKGDHPRTLHVRGRLGDDFAFFSVDIQSRTWISRNVLAEIGGPDFKLVDEPKGSAEWGKNQWLETFSGWLGRSYTRVALPDEFNDALAASKIKDILHSKLAKHADKLYGIFISLALDSEEQWSGILGLMPPPYLLSIKLVAFNNEDPAPLKAGLIKQLFVDKVENGTDGDGNKILVTRAELAQQHNIRLIKQAIDAQTTAEVYLDELKDYIRYSLVDHLSSASMASPA